MVVVRLEAVLRATTMAGTGLATRPACAVAVVARTVGVGEAESRARVIAHRQMHVQAAAALAVTGRPANVGRAVAAAVDVVDSAVASAVVVAVVWAEERKSSATSLDGEVCCPCGMVLIMPKIGYN